MGGEPIQVGILGLILVLLFKDVIRPLMARNGGTDVAARLGRVETTLSAIREKVAGLNVSVQALTKAQARNIGHVKKTL